MNRPWTPFDRDVAENCIYPCAILSAGLICSLTKTKEMMLGFYPTTVIVNLNWSDSKCERGTLMLLVQPTECP